MNEEQFRSQEITGCGKLIKHENCGFAMVVSTLAPLFLLRVAYRMREVASFSNRSYLMLSLLLNPQRNRSFLEGPLRLS
jgi:hypothetical protein